MNAPAAGTSNAERLRIATRQLEPVTETPRLDAEILLAHALGLSRTQLLARLAECAEAPAFDALMARRLNHEPIAYILGEWEFFSLAFNVVPPLLVPRPETEHLVEAVLEFAGTRRVRILDLCTGTGCVAVALAHSLPSATVTAVDIHPVAIEIASENAVRHRVADRVTFRRGDLFDALDEHDPSFDIACANPPYVEEGAWDALPPVIRLHEDPRALVAGQDGLDVVRRIVQRARDYLVPGGLLAFEIGESQAAAVADLLREAGYEAIASRRDLAGIERIAIARAPCVVDEVD